MPRKGVESTNSSLLCYLSTGLAPFTLGHWQGSLFLLHGLSVSPVVVEKKALALASRRYIIARPHDAA